MSNDMGRKVIEALYGVPEPMPITGRNLAIYAEKYDLARNSGESNEEFSARLIAHIRRQYV